jgi:hypothetical protein
MNRRDSASSCSVRRTTISTMSLWSAPDTRYGCFGWLAFWNKACAMAGGVKLSFAPMIRNTRLRCFLAFYRPRRPKTATPLVVPTYTFPLTIIGVPKWLEMPN